MGKKGGGRVRVVQKGPKMPNMTNPMADFAIPPDEELQLPIKPPSDSGYLFWPMGETFSMKYDNFSVIYPNYLDSNKTVKLGRRISAKDAVPEPTVQDIHEALASLNVRHVIQPNKGYSRDAISRWDNLGRILVDMEGAVEKGVVGVGKDGAYDLDDIPDMNDDDNDKENNNESGRGGGKKQLIRQIALIIPTLSGRQKRVEEKAKAAEAEKLKLAKAEKAAAPSKPSKGSGGSGSSSKKKKGKKKK